MRHLFGARLPWLFRTPGLFNAWAASTAPQTAAQELLLFTHRTGRPEADFSARLVGPEIGPRIDVVGYGKLVDWEGLLARLRQVVRQDDPPVGAAMPAFCAYLASFLRPGTYPFSVERGGDARRRSLLQVEMEHRGRPEMRLRIGGQAVVTASGSIRLP